MVLNCAIISQLYALGLQSEDANEVALEVCVCVVILYPYKMCLCVVEGESFMCVVPRRGTVMCNAQNRVVKINTYHSSHYNFF